MPAYAPTYPKPGRDRLFHVTAFRAWSKAAAEETRAACEHAGVEYSIGYERLDPDILRAVWRDICSASFVVADVTNFNLNALLELGIAHALGRPTLILTQNREPHLHLPAIRRVRTHLYSSENRDALRKLVSRFLAGEESSV